MDCNALSTHEQIAHFIDLLFEPTDLVEVRMLPLGAGPDAHPIQEWPEARQLPGLADHFLELNAQGYNIYVGANPRSCRAGNADSVEIARVLFVDLDNDVTPSEARQRVIDAGVPFPTMIVSTGHGQHLWWVLEEPKMDLEQWTGRQKALIRVLDGDPVVHDPPRIMRLPGLVNHKPPPKPVSLFAVDRDARHSIDCFPAAILTPSERSKRSEKAERSQRSQAPLPKPVPSLMDDPRVREAISLTQPTGPDQRRRKLFTLARIAKGLFPELDLAGQLEIVTEWHRAAAPRINHKNIEVSFADFADGWDRVKYPGNTGPLAEALERAIARPPPEGASRFPTQCPRTLFALCRELQITAGEEAFWLDERSAGALLGVDQSTINFWFRRFRDAGLIHRVEKGRSGRASRYRYLGNLR